MTQEDSCYILYFQLDNTFTVITKTKQVNFCEMYQQKKSQLKCYLAGPGILVKLDMMVMIMNCLKIILIYKLI